MITSLRRRVMKVLLYEQPSFTSVALIYFFWMVFHGLFIARNKVWVLDCANIVSITVKNV